MFPQFTPVQYAKKKGYPQLHIRFSSAYLALFVYSHSKNDRLLRKWLNSWKAMLSLLTDFLQMIKRFSQPFRRIAVVTTLFCCYLNTLTAQSDYQPYSYAFYQKLNNVLYHTDTKFHTSIKPIRMDGALRKRHDELMNNGVVERRSWGARKLYNEHLVTVEGDEYSFYADFLPDFQLGRDFAGGGRTLWLNTRGAQAGFTVEDRFVAYVNFFENQAVFPGYLDDYIFTHTVTPGQGYGKTLQSNRQMKDWMYGSANLSYTVNTHLTVTLAYDKHFVGDGYRSVLLSDVSSNYSALKLTGEWGNVQYMSLWSYMLDPMHPRSLDSAARAGDNWKWGSFQYVDWNVNNRFSVGLFQSLVWGNPKAAGRRSSDFNSYHPTVIQRPGELINTPSDSRIRIGLNSKYKVLKNMAAYGQFLLDGLSGKNWAAQAGLRGFDLFGIEHLNFLVEYNTAAPYTYAESDPVDNYSNYGQPLAHPWGANFRELVGMLNYSYQRFDLSFQSNWGQFGTDPDPFTSVGGDIFQRYPSAREDLGGRIGQGVRNNLLYADGRIGYLLNPTYNLRIEAGAVYRRHGIPAEGKHHQTGMLTLGIRSSFRNLYYDF